MSKAEDLAKELFPDWKMTGVPTVDGQAGSMVRIQRVAYIKGYHQAEKDLELTWEDMALVCKIEFSIVTEYKGEKLPQKELFYQEILKRFREMKK